jgi:hypothetical protein
MDGSTNPKIPSQGTSAETGGEVRVKMNVEKKDRKEAKDKKSKKTLEEESAKDPEKQKLTDVDLEESREDKSPDSLRQSKPLVKQNSGLMGILADFISRPCCLTPGGARQRVETEEEDNTKETKKRSKKEDTTHSEPDSDIEEMDMDIMLGVREVLTSFRSKGKNTHPEEMTKTR